MRITAKQILTLSCMVPTVGNDNFSFEISQTKKSAKGKSSLRVQDGKLTYKLKADGTFADTMANPAFPEKTEPVATGS